MRRARERATRGAQLAAAREDRLRARVDALAALLPAGGRGAAALAVAAAAAAAGGGGGGGGGPIPAAAGAAPAPPRPAPLPPPAGSEAAMRALVGSIAAKLRGAKLMA